MARTKKEIEEQASAAEPETTGTEYNPIPQTDPETPPGEVANAGMTDLELAAANTLDPDAPQTDLESADSDTGSHTDLESAEISGERQALDAESASGPQTEFETELADDNSAQAAGDDAAEGDAEPPAPSRRRRASRKKATEAQNGGEDAPAEHPEEEQSDSGQPQKLRMPGRRRQRVVSIDAERTVETDTDRLRNDLLDLVESLKSKKILTGTIQGVEFELRTDAGVFPAPIVVDETGVLTMDLGGSTTYTLSCINSTVPIPDPSVEQTPDTQQSSEEVQQPQEQKTATEPNSGIPIVPLVVFLVGLACGGGGLVALHFAKRPIMTSGRTRTTSSIERKKRPQTEMGSPRLKSAKKLMKLPRKCGFFVDHFTVFCYNSIVTRYCAQALDTPGRLGVRPARSGWEIVTEPLYRGPTRRRSCLKRMWPEGR